MKRILLALSLAVAISTAAQANEFGLGVDLTYPQPDFGTVPVPVTVPLSPIITMTQPSGPTIGIAPIIDNGFNTNGVLVGGQGGNTQFNGVLIDTPVGTYIGGSVKYPVYPETTVTETQQQQ